MALEGLIFVENEDEMKTTHVKRMPLLGPCAKKHVKGLHS